MPTTWEVLTQDEIGDEVTPTSWRDHGPFILWATPRGVGIVFVNVDPFQCYALVRYSDGVVFTHGPAPSGELMGWVERGLSDGGRLTWEEVLLQEDPETIPPPEAKVAPDPEGPPREPPVQRAANLRNTPIGND